MKIILYWNAALLCCASIVLLPIVDVGAKKHSIRRHPNKKAHHDAFANPSPETPISYGVDVSFPMHHDSFTTVDNPLGDSQKVLYADFMHGCRTAYPQLADRCEMYERERIELNMDQPATLQNFTDTGYKKIRAPKELWDIVKEFWDKNHGREQKESWPRAETSTNHWIAPTFLLDIGDDNLEGGGASILQELHEAARPTLEEWSGQDLTPTHIYGVRSYTEGSILTPHVDGIRRVTSAIINVAQDVDEPWILEVIDLQGKAQNVTMEAGDMVLYESRTVIHGRPYPLKGRYFANMFVHFEPTVDYYKNYDQEEAADRAEGDDRVQDRDDSDEEESSDEASSDEEEEEEEL